MSKYTLKHFAVFLKVGNMHGTCASKYNEKGSCPKVRTVITQPFTLNRPKGGFQKILQRKYYRQLSSLCSHQIKHTAQINLKEMGMVLH